MSCHFEQDAVFSQNELFRRADLPHGGEDGDFDFYVIELLHFEFRESRVVESGVKCIASEVVAEWFSGADIADASAQSAFKSDSHEAASEFL